MQTEVIEKYYDAKLKDGAVPTILPAYYSSHSATKRTRLSIDDKNDELLHQTVSLSLEAEVQLNEKFRIQNVHDLQLSYTFFQLLIYGPLGIPTNIH